MDSRKLLEDTLGRHRCWQQRRIPCRDRLSQPCSGALSEFGCWDRAENELRFPPLALHQRMRSRCRLDPTQRPEALAALSPQQQETYLKMVGQDGWCIHFDSGSRRCRIYEQRPDFCRVDNLMVLFGRAGEDDPDQLAISCCRQQIRVEYGGRGKVMRRFMSANRLKS